MQVAAPAVPGTDVMPVGQSMHTVAVPSLNMPRSQGTSQASPALFRALPGGQPGAAAAAAVVVGMQQQQ